MNKIREGGAICSVVVTRSFRPFQRSFLVSRSPYHFLIELEGWPLLGKESEEVKRVSKLMEEMLLSLIKQLPHRREIEESPLFFSFFFLFLKKKIESMDVSCINSLLNKKIPVLLNIKGSHFPNPAGLSSH